MRIIITHDGTHSAETWADVLLEELIPLLPGWTELTLLKVQEARDKLRPALIEAMNAVRTHEILAWESLSAGEREVMAHMASYAHGGEGLPDIGIGHTSDMSKITHGKLRPLEEWVDSYVRKICAIASGLNGDKPASNQMIENVWAVLSRYVSAVQSTERQNHITSRHLQIKR